MRQNLKLDDFISFKPSTLGTYLKHNNCLVFTNKEIILLFRICCLGIILIGELYIRGHETPFIEKKKNFSDGMVHVSLNTKII